MGGGRTESLKKQNIGQVGNETRLNSIESQLKKVVVVVVVVIVVVVTIVGHKNLTLSLVKIGSIINDIL